MKAKDLAALAALGVAGYAAYDKFGKKDEKPAKKKMGEDLDMTNQGAYERATRPESNAENVEMGTKGAYLPETPEYQTKGAYLPDTAELGTKGAYLDDTPEFRTRGAYLPDGAVVAAPSAKIKDKNSGVAAPAVVEAAPKTRAFTPPGVQDSMGSFTKAGQADAAAPGTRAFTPPGYVASANDYNRASAPNMPSSAALGDYTRAINPAMQADRMAAAASPSARKTDALAVTSRANQAAYLAQKRAEQAQMDALRSSGGARAKGGVVKKMASGGLASSKMSKPSGASRGDGIAQRGRTRGTLR